MEEFPRLIFLCFAMLVGCYLAGAVPLIVSLSESKLRLISVMGAGLLVGTALSVIIPEGVHALYDSVLEGHSHSHRKVLEEHGEVAAAAPIGPAQAMDAAHSHGNDPAELHTYIGISLVLGFIFMLLIDQIGGGHPHSDVESNGGRARSKITTTIGLVVHAAADGIAMGAAATTSRTDVEMIVFAAIMLHKAPAAFGLVSFLLHDNMEKSRIRLHLTIFALAAPVGAIITYLFLSQGTKEALETINATGIAMLFSAGTFLYVATVHVLPEIASSRTTSASEADSSSTNEHRTSAGGFSWLELLLLVSGCLFPLLLSFNHHH